MIFYWYTELKQEKAKIRHPKLLAPCPLIVNTVPFLRIQGMGLRSGLCGLHTGPSNPGSTRGLVGGGWWVTVTWMEVRCIYGDIHKYPTVSLPVEFKAKTHKINAALRLRMMHILILGKILPGFHYLLWQCVGMPSWPLVLCSVCSLYYLHQPMFNPWLWDTTCLFILLFRFKSIWSLAVTK